MQCNPEINKWVYHVSCSNIKYNILMMEVL